MTVHRIFTIFTTPQRHTQKPIHVVERNLSEQVSSDNNKISDVNRKAAQQYSSFFSDISGYFFFIFFACFVVGNSIFCPLKKVRLLLNCDQSDICERKNLAQNCFSRSQFLDSQTTVASHKILQKRLLLTDLNIFLKNYILFSNNLVKIKFKKIPNCKQFSIKCVPVLIGGISSAAL